ncbi:thiosulfate sulfurtransferase GlpE [Vibrio cholerae]|nr:thiosulfate sulfurtransferase GlpE [Vibrio cholerae]
MDHFLHIDVNAAQAMMEQKQAHLVDIRDPQSFQLAHAKNAYHLTNQSMVQFMEQAEFDQPVLVMCYHGISSQGAAQYLVNRSGPQFSDMTLSGRSVLIVPNNTGTDYD